MEARSFFLERRGCKGRHCGILRVRRVRGIALCEGCSVGGVCAVRESNACGIALCEGCSVGGVCAVRESSVCGIALCEGCSVGGVCAVRESSACGIALCEVQRVRESRVHGLLRCAARVHGA